MTVMRLLQLLRRPSTLQRHPGRMPAPPRSRQNLKPNRCPRVFFSVFFIGSGSSFTGFASGLGFAGSGFASVRCLAQSSHPTNTSGLLFLPCLLSIITVRGLPCFLQIDGISVLSFYLSCSSLSSSLCCELHRLGWAGVPPLPLLPLHHHRRLHLLPVVSVPRLRPTS